MMYAVDIDQPLISVRYVPVHVGLPSSAEAVFFFSTRHSAPERSTTCMTRAIERPFRQMTARARLNELFDSSVVGRLRSDHTRGVAWQAGAAYAGLIKKRRCTGRRSNESRLERDGLDKSILRFSGVRAPTASVRRDRTDSQYFIPSLHLATLATEVRYFSIHCPAGPRLCSEM